MFLQHIQGSEADSKALENARGHCQPYVTQDVVDRSHDARHGKPRSHRRDAGSEICQLPAARAIV